MANHLAKEKELVPFIDGDDQNGDSVLFYVMSRETSNLLDEATILEIREKVSSGEILLSEDEIQKIENSLRKQDEVLSME